MFKAAEKATQFLTWSVDSHTGRLVCLQFIFEADLKHNPLPDVVTTVNVPSLFLSAAVTGVWSLPGEFPRHHPRGAGGARAESQDLPVLLDDLRRDGAVCV